MVATAYHTRALRFLSLAQKLAVGEWEDARRRIDLPAVDKAGRLVVELQRDDGARMDLQALRYAAMVSSMDFDDIANAYEPYLAKSSPDSDLEAREGLSFLLVANAGEEEEPAISTEVRIVLVSADFSRELTTAVLWLSRRRDCVSAGSVYRGVLDQVNMPSSVRRSCLQPLLSNESDRRRRAASAVSLDKEQRWQIVGHPHRVARPAAQWTLSAPTTTSRHVRDFALPPGA